MTAATCPSEGIKKRDAKGEMKMTLITSSVP